VHVRVPKGVVSIQANAQYNIAKPDSIPVKIAAYQRRRMFDAFLATSGIAKEDTLLDVGVTTDESYSHSNYLEAWYPHKDKITACGVEDASFLETKYPGLRFVEADGRRLPFADREFDFVHSSAVLEHVGSFEMQRNFLREIWRVAAKGIFITTPNRWFPIEFHTLMPLVHWLPPAHFREICRRRKLGFFALEENLNLLSASQLRRHAEAAGLENIRITHARLGGWSSNLLLSAKMTGV
jgi:hypothetical protein